MEFRAHVHQILDPLIVVGATIALLTAPSILLGRRGRPLAALSWLFATIALPVVGPAAWWLIGRTGFARPKRRRSRRALEFAQRRAATLNLEVDQNWRVPHAARQAIFRTQSNCARVLAKGPAAFAAMEASLRSATTSIHALYYIWSDDETGNRWFDLLIERARAGVCVRILLDHIGSADCNPLKIDALRAAGGSVAFFMVPNFWSLGRPTFNFRNHRKILVIDHQVAYTGGMNVGDEYAGPWKDVHVEICGPAVEVLEDVLLDDWYFATQEYIEPATTGESEQNPARCEVNAVACDCTVVASGPDDEQPWMHDAFFRAIVGATRRIWIATPYFIPSESIVTALRTARARGVDVRVMVPRKNDILAVQWASRAYYGGLVDSGVRIFEFETAMNHAKVVVVDESVCTVGSANVDPRSFRLNFEVGVFFESQQLTHELANWFEEHLRSSHEITREQVKATPPQIAMLQALAHLFSPML
jgi:cardiolipin synthase